MSIIAVSDVPVSLDDVLISNSCILEHFTHAVTYWWRSDETPVKTVLPLLAKIQEARSKMKRIWENSPMALTGLETKLDDVMKCYEEVKLKLVAGEVNEDDVWPRHLRLD